MVGVDTALGPMKARGYDSTSIHHVKRDAGESIVDREATPFVYAGGCHVM